MDGKTGDDSPFGLRCGVDAPDISHGVPFPVPVESSDSMRGLRSTVGVEDLLSYRFRTTFWLSIGSDLKRTSG